MKRIFLLFLVFFACSSTKQSGLLRPVRLTCEYMQDPSVVDVLKPRLVWVNMARDGERGQRQTAYRIIVASSKEQLASPDLWDSKVVPSDQSNRVAYMGNQLESRQECWWQVKVWDKNGHETDWSEPAFWRMGLLDRADWHGEWIGAPWDGEEHFVRPDYPG